MNWSQAILIETTPQVTLKVVSSWQRTLPKKTGSVNRFCAQNFKELKMVSNLFLQSSVSDLPHFRRNRHVYSGKHFYINIGVDGPDDLGNSCF